MLSGYLHILEFVCLLRLSITEIEGHDAVVRVHTILKPEHINLGYKITESLQLYEALKQFFYVMAGGHGG